MDSTALLSQTACPKHIIIVGGGVIGIEFATFFYRLGVPVTIVEMLDRILGPLDKEVTDQVDAKLRKNGVELILGVRVESIESGLKVHYASVKDGAKGTAEGDAVLMAGGRKPNVRNMGLEDIGLAMDRKGFVQVDGLCRTNLPGVYAIGDMNGKMQLAHVASAQGLLVADHIAGKPRRELNYNHIPSCVYCNPETAMVGLTEEQARATGRDIGVGRFNLSGNGKALTMGENEGFVKFLFDKATEEILGCHILGPRATDLAAEVAAVMECEGTISEIGNTVHPHPTVSEVLMEAAHACHGDSVNAPRARR
jgi:dihydrolipoamide dehydrogenase